MSARDDLAEELEGLPEPVIRQVVAYVRQLKLRGGETALLSEAVLAREWLSPEEDEAWAGLCKMTPRSAVFGKFKGRMPAYRDRSDEGGYG